MVDRRLLEVRIGLALVAGLGILVFGMLVLGQLAGDAATEPIPVAEVLAGSDRLSTYGSGDIRIVGWYAELSGDCVGDDGGRDATVAWLQRECPLRVLLTVQPDAAVTQAELERSGLRLAGLTGRPFPPRAVREGANLQLQQLVFVGHFADAASQSCVPDRADRCLTTFVVTNYSRYLK